MSKEYMHVIDEHECEVIQKQHYTDGEIGVQEFNNDKWYWVDYQNDRTIMNQISYCPYCGVKLGE